MALLTTSAHRSVAANQVDRLGPDSAYAIQLIERTKGAMPLSIGDDSPCQRLADSRQRRQLRPLRLIDIDHEGDRREPQRLQQLPTIATPPATRRGESSRHPNRAQAPTPTPQRSTARGAATQNAPLNSSLATAWLSGLHPRRKPPRDAMWTAIGLQLDCNWTAIGLHMWSPHQPAIMQQQDYQIEA